MKATILFALGLLTSAVQAQWSVAGYTGVQCTGQQLYVHENPGRNGLYCDDFEFAVSTSSVIVNVDDDAEFTYEFELHDDETCSDLAFGHFELGPGMSFCTQTQSAKSILARHA